MRTLLLGLLALTCRHAPAPPPPPPSPAPASAAAARSTPAAAPACLSDERRWGTTCCRVVHAGPRRTWMSCRGPQLGKACHRRSDCDLACGCDQSLVHHDGQTGVTGACTGFMPSGEWLCQLDDRGQVSSLIID